LRSGEYGNFLLLRKLVGLCKLHEADANTDLDDEDLRFRYFAPLKVDSNNIKTFMIDITEVLFHYHLISNSFTVALPLFQY